MMGGTTSVVYVQWHVTVGYRAACYSDAGFLDFWTPKQDVQCDLF